MNRFKGIYCADGLAEHAVHFWAGSRGTLVERNIIVDCARGVGFGLGDRGHIGGIIRNNVVVAGRPVLDTGIGLESAAGARVHHNTGGLGRSCRPLAPITAPSTCASPARPPRFATTSRPGSRAWKTAGPGIARGERGARAGSLVCRARTRQLHLDVPVSAAVNRGVRVPGAGLDIDGEPHDAGSTDLGADELRP